MKSVEEIGNALNIYWIIHLVIIFLAHMTALRERCSKVCLEQYGMLGVPGQLGEQGISFVVDTDDFLVGVGQR